MNKWVIVGIILFVLIVGVVGVYIWQNKNVQNENLNSLNNQEVNYYQLFSKIGDELKNKLENS